MYLKLLIGVLLFLPSSNSDKQILTKQFITAFNSNDVKTLKSLLHPLFIVTFIDGTQVDKAQAINASNSAHYDVLTTEEIISMEEINNEVLVTMDIKGEYFLNIGAKYPLFTRRFIFKNERIHRIKTDSLPGYSKGLKELKKCEMNFDQWHKMEYGLKVPDSLVLERSREFFKVIIKKQ